MRSFLTVLFLSTVFVSYGQQSKIDSLTIEFNRTIIDTVKARLLSDICIAAFYTNTEFTKQMNDSLIRFSLDKSEKYLGIGYRMRGTLKLLDGNYDDAEKDYKKALDLFLKVKNIKLEAAIYSNLATLFGRKNDLKKSKEFHLKSIKLNETLENELKNLNSYFNLGVIDAQLQNLVGSTEYYIKALEIAEKSDNTKYIVFINNRLGINYLKLNQDRKAEEHLKKALSVAERDENNYGLAEIHNSLGYLYEDKYENYKQSLFHYEKSLFYNKLTNQKIGISRSLGNIGLQYIRLKEFDKAKEFIENELKVSDTIDYKNGKITANLNLSHLFIEKGNISEANEYLNRANNLIGESSKMEYRENFYRISKAFESIGAYKQALTNINAYMVLTDSLFEKNGVDKIAEIETKYQTEKKEKENLLLEQKNTAQKLQLEKENRRKWFFGIGLIASLIALIIFAYFYKKNKKQKMIIESLQKELHHRVKNNLAIIDALIDDIKDEFGNEAFKNKLTDLQNRINSINEVHQQLYTSDEVKSIHAKKYIEKLAKNVQKSFPDSNITIKQNIDDSLKLDTNKSFPVGLIVNEFLTNSYKYAFDEDVNGIVTINMKEVNQVYSLSLSDNGKGLSEDFDISKLDSFGIDVMQLLSKQLKGTFSFNGTNGVKLYIEFPKT